MSGCDTRWVKLQQGKEKTREGLVLCDGGSDAYQTEDFKSCYPAQGWVMMCLLRESR